MQANRAVSRREVAFRKALWAAGARGYRIHPRLPGRPDLVFPRLKLAVFVNGCYWHLCGICRLPIPKANREFWVKKLGENARRDQIAGERLRESGWETLTVWEHEIRPDPVPRAISLADEVSVRRLRKASGCRE